MYACVYSPGYEGKGRMGGNPAFPAHPAVPAHPALPASALTVVAQQFSPRYQTRGDLVVVDVRGLERLFGSARAIGEELRREAADRGLRVHVAIAQTQTAATIAAMSRPGVVVIEPGGEAGAIAPLPLQILCGTALSGPPFDGDPKRVALQMFSRWGLRSLGDLAALPAGELSARIGQQAAAWHAMARGVDVRPLVPDVEDERFEAALDLEWPIEGLEPLSFVLTRLLEPLSLRLEQRDRGVAVLHVELRLVTKDVCARRLELPTPMRDVKTLRTLALLDLEAQALFTPGPPASRTPAAAAAAMADEQVGIDRVAIVIEPTPGRVWQHTLFTRPHPTPEQLSTLLARLGAAMGQDRIGAPVLVDSHRPGAFAMAPFATEHTVGRDGRTGRTGGKVEHAEPLCPPRPAFPALPAFQIAAIRRCRQPVPARVAADANGRPIKVTTDRRGFAGGSVVRAAGPWKTSGEWWVQRAGGAGRAGEAGGAGQAGWDRDEWDVALSDGASYRVFLDRGTNHWFIDAILD
jgi:protein ImuB